MYTGRPILCINYSITLSHNLHKSRSQKVLHVQEVLQDSDYIYVVFKKVEYHRRSQNNYLL